jgi:hypothetical protein
VGGTGETYYFGYPPILGRWSSYSRVSEYVYQAQTLVGDAKVNVETIAASGAYARGGFDVTLNSSKLILGPLGKGGVAEATFNLTVAKIPGPRESFTPVDENVTLKATGFIQAAKGSSLTILHGKLEFPTTDLGSGDKIGHGSIVIQEQVNSGGEAGTFGLAFRRP